MREPGGVGRGLQAPEHAAGWGRLHLWAFAQASRDPSVATGRELAWAHHGSAASSLPAGWTHQPSLLLSSQPSSPLPAGSPARSTPAPSQQPDVKQALQVPARADGRSGRAPCGPRAACCCISALPWRSRTAPSLPTPKSEPHPDAPVLERRSLALWHGVGRNSHRTLVAS